MGQVQEYKFDVFLCHNSRDKPAVEEIALELRERSVRPWLDKWELRPGLPWQRAIEQQIQTIAAAAVFVGPSGFGPWQAMEQEALLREFVDRQCPVIPVILRGVQQVPTLPVFLAGMTWIDFRHLDTDPIEQLIWGVTGRKPDYAATKKPPQTISGALALRQPIRDFTGRTSQRNRIRKDIAAGNTVIGIQGMGGIGKTELALSLAKELASDFPDTQMMIDLQGTGPGPLSCSESMRRILQSLLPGNRLPGEPEELATVYRNELKSRRGLLLFDNALGREQLESLVPADSWLVLVTSRQHFTLPGMIVHDLEAMERSEAQEMLLKISSRRGSPDSPAQDEILRMCGFLPLAIRMAGRTLAERPDWSFDEYARRLKNRSERVKALDEVMASIGLSHELLGQDDRNRLSQLSIVNAPFDRHSAAAIWDVSEGEADRSLGLLLRHGLLEWDEGVGRYTMNNLVHDFVSDRLDAQTIRAAHIRHARHLIGRLGEWNKQYQEGGEKVVPALAEFDANWPLVQNEFAACQSCKDEIEAVRLACETPDSAPQLFDLRRHPRERIEWREEALAAARKLGDRRHEGHHLGNLGLAYLQLDDPRRAVDYFKQRIEIAIETGDRHKEGRGLGNLGRAYAKLGQGKLAIECQENFLKIAREIGDRRGEGNALHNLALVHDQLNATSRAIALHLQALAVSREIGDYRAEGEFSGKLGQAFSRQGDARRAIECYEQALKINRDIGNRELEAENCWDLGRELEKLGELARATQLIQAGVSIGQELGHPDATVRADYLVDLESRLAEALSRRRSTDDANHHERPEIVKPQSPSDADAVVESTPADMEGPHQDTSGVLRSNTPETTPGPHHELSSRQRPSGLWAGRRDALEQLTSALAKLNQGRGETVFVWGRSGIGKTALANRFIEQHCRQAETLVLSGKCYVKARRPFKGFDTLIDSLAEYLKGLRRESVERVMPVDVGSLCHIFPQLDRVEVFKQACGSIGAVEILERRRRGFEALRELFCRLARFHRLVLFIDDLQWGGRDTADLFAYLFRAPDAPMSLTIAAIRDEKQDSGFLQSIRDHAAKSQDSLVWQELRLGRLAADEARELAAAVLGDLANDDITQRIASQADGHPLLVRLLSDHTLTEYKRDRQVVALPTLDEAVLAVAESVGQHARQLVELLAVAGCALEEELLAKAAGLRNEPEVFQELQQKRLIRAGDVSDLGRIDIYHDRIRETIFASLAAEQVSTYSRCLTSVLEASDADAALLGELFTKSGELEKAGEAFVRAARTAHASLAFHRASELYNLAIERLQPVGQREVELRRSLGDALCQSGVPLTAAQQYRLSAEAATNPQRLDLYCLSAQCLLTGGHVEAGIVTLKKVLAECSIAFPRNPMIALASLLWNRFLLRLSGYQVSALKDEVDEVKIRRLQAYWAAVSGLSVIDPLRAADFAARHLRLALRCGQPTYVIRALTAFSGHVAAGGYRKRQQVEYLLTAIEEQTQKDGKPYSKAAMALARGVAAHLQSLYPTSVKFCDQAVALLLDGRSREMDPRCANSIWELNVARSIAMWSLMYMGRINDLAQRQPELLRVAEETNNRFAALNFSTQIMTHIMLGADDPEEARRRLDADAQHLSTYGFTVQHQNHLLAMAFLEQYCDHGLLAWQHIENARRRYTKSVLSRVQHMRIDFLQAKGRAALAAAGESSNPGSFLRVVKNAANQLARHRTPWADAHATLLRAALAAANYESHAPEYFEEAAGLFERSDGQLFAAAARIRAAELTASKCEEAKEKMIRLGVRNPQRMSAALIPGK